MDKQQELLEEPQLVCFGLPENDGNGLILDDEILDTIDKTIDSIPRNRRRDNETVTEAVRRAVRAVVNEIWGKKPVCTVFLHRAR